jgi:hypothetical protein
MSSLPRGSDFVKGLKDPQNILIPHGIHKTVAKRQEADRAKKDAAVTIAAEDEAATTANLDIAAQRRKRRFSSLFAGGRQVLGAPAGRGTPSGAGSPVSSSSLAGGGGYSAGSSSASYGGSGRLSGGGRMYAGIGPET